MQAPNECVTCQGGRDFEMEIVLIQFRAAPVGCLVPLLVLTCRLWVGAAGEINESLGTSQQRESKINVENETSPCNYFPLGEACDSFWILLS